MSDPSKKNSPTGSNGVHSPPPTDLTEANLPTLWGQVLQEVGVMLRSQLQRDGRPAIAGPNSLVIRFPTSYSSAYDSVTSEASQDAVRAALKRVTGKDWVIRVEAGPAEADSATPPPRTQDRPADVLQLPLFKKAAEALGAQLVRVDDGFSPLAPVPTAAPDPDEA